MGVFLGVLRLLIAWNLDSAHMWKIWRVTLSEKFSKMCVFIT